MSHGAHLAAVISADAAGALAGSQLRTGCRCQTRALSQSSEADLCRRVCLLGLSELQRLGLEALTKLILG